MKNVPDAAHDLVRAQWLEREAALRQGFAANGVIPADLPARRTGLELMQGILGGELPVPPIARTLDFILVEAERGRAVFQGTPKFDHYNPSGSVHGGWIATLLDSCVGCAVHTALPAGKGYTTLELKVNYVRGLTQDSGPLRAEGKVIHAGGRVATAEGRLVDPAGRLYAHCTTTCLILDLAPPR
ncbi:MAG: PaaI family thioesterase [Nevskia sp.]|nr:PaaI family thioesterase [Nevskia sp.]